MQRAGYASGNDGRIQTQPFPLDPQRKHDSSGEWEQSGRLLFRHTFCEPPLYVTVTSEFKDNGFTASRYGLVRRFVRASLMRLFTGPPRI